MPRPPLQRLEDQESSVPCSSSMRFLRRVHGYSQCIPMAIACLYPWCRSRLSGPRSADQRSLSAFRRHHRQRRDLDKTVPVLDLRSGPFGRLVSLRLGSAARSLGSAPSVGCGAIVPMTLTVWCRCGSKSAAVFVSSRYRVSRLGLPGVPPPAAVAEAASPSTWCQDVMCAGWKGASSGAPVADTS